MEIAWCDQEKAVMMGILLLVMVVLILVRLKLAIPVLILQVLLDLVQQAEPGQ